MITKMLAKIKTLIKPRQPNSSKGDYAHTLIVAGNQGKIGSAVMHPEVTSDKPGKCPKCGMALVVKK